MTKINNEELQKIRHEMGYYSIQELCSIFSCGREKIDEGLNTGNLEYISPNFKTRFIKLSDYLEYIKKNKNTEVKNENIKANQSR